MTVINAFPGFRFLVEIAKKPQAAFTECTLPVIEWEIQEVKEGGLNNYIHQLPGRRKGGKLTLKNGIGTDELVKWCLEGMKEKFTRKEVTVILKDSTAKTVMTWNMSGAYPVKWTGPQFKSSDNTVAIQTLELACHQIEVIAP